MDAWPLKLHLASLKSPEINQENERFSVFKENYLFEHLASQSQEAVGVPDLPKCQVEGKPTVWGLQSLGLPSVGLWQSAA